MSFTIRVQNYRGLRKIAWSPEGVCALVGPNASGKTTLLDVPALLHDVMDRGLARAFDEHGGLGAVRTFRTREDEPIEFEVSVDAIRWRFSPTFVSGVGFRSSESVHDGDDAIVTRRTGDDHADFMSDRLLVGDRMGINLPLQVGALEPLHRVLSRYRLYGQYDVPGLRRGGSPDSGERRLDRRGANVFSVLRNWRDRRPDQARVEFVIDGLREVFSDFFEDLEFEKVAQIVGAEIRLRPYDKLLSASLAPDGWFAALLHLTAVASTDPGDVIAIDEPENALHPGAIRVLLSRIREWCRRKTVTVLLATHSPVIISSFRECPGQIYVMEPGHEVLPVALTHLRDPDWLAHFALGDLYVHEEFGAPRERDDDESRTDNDRPV